MMTQETAELGKPLTANDLVGFKEAVQENYGLEWAVMVRNTQVGTVRLKKPAIGDTIDAWTGERFCKLSIRSINPRRGTIHVERAASPS